MNMFVRYLGWNPSPLLKASMLLLIGATLVTVWQPKLWPWTVGAVCLNHLLLTAAGLWPRSKVLGQNFISLPPRAAAQGAVAITIDDGPDPEVTPRVLDILDLHDAKATFFCIGELAERHPELCREIVRRGHTVENHSQFHNHLFSLFGPKRIFQEIQLAQTVLSGITGQTPRFFRPSAGLRNPFLDPVLARVGLHLVSWSKRGFDTRETDADNVFKRLAHNLKGGDILLLHDGNAARTPDGTPVILDVLPRLLDEIAQARLQTVTLRSSLP